MGVSTDALLLYGVPLEEEAFEHFDEDDASAEQSGPAYMACMGNEEDGVALERHCSGECPMYFVAIPKQTTTAWRGHPQNVTGKELIQRPEWDDTLRSFVTKHKLKTAGEPGWWIASDWG